MLVIHRGKLVLVAIIWMALVGVPDDAQGKIYLCKPEHLYDLDAGELTNTSVGTGVETIIFDEDAGTLRVGHAENMFTNERWRLLRINVVTKGNGFSAVGQYMHNGTILSTVIVQSWDNPASFIWHSVIPFLTTGTCEVHG